MRCTLWIPKVVSTGSMREGVTSAAAEHAARARQYAVQILLVVLINVPTVSFGLALGWISLSSGESGEFGELGEEGEESGAVQAVVAATTTFLASLVAVPVWARALAAGRKPALIATSFAFVVCWSLKLAGSGWWLVAARAAAGVGGAGAWAIAPLLAREMCEERFRGAAVAALVPANNLGLLLMYLAAELQLPHRTAMWCSLALSAAHCFLFLLVPESPAYLAATGNPKEARAALAWVRGVHASAPWLQEEMSALPAPEPAIHSPISHLREMLGECCRRRALLVCLVAVVGQEMCGVLTVLQFAERIFLLAGEGGGVSAARLAVLVGAVQLAVSVAALYLVEKPLLVVTSFATALCLALGAACTAGAAGGGGSARWAALALAGAVAADSAGVQPVPYAMLADAFDYQWRGCAVVVVSAAGCLGNAVEAAVLPSVAATWGLPVALWVAAGVTLGYAVWTLAVVPESRALAPAALQRRLCPRHRHDTP